MASAARSAEKPQNSAKESCRGGPMNLMRVLSGGTGSRSSHNNLRVVYTQEDESADLYIETLVGKIGKNYAVRVATSDALIQLSALRSGVLRVSAAELERELERTNGEIAAVLRRLREEARHAAGQESPLRALDPKSNPDKEEPI